MKQCHICNNLHNHVYCPLCGAVNAGDHSYNRAGIEVVSALGRVCAAMRHARKIQNNVPVPVSRVMVGSSHLR